MIRKTKSNNSSAEETVANIKTDFGFSLKTEDKTYIFFTSTLDESKLWVRILSLIIEMNQKKLSINLINPFDFEKLKSEKMS